MDQLQCLITIFFLTVVDDLIRGYLFPNVEQSKLFQAMFVLCLYTTYLFLSIILNWSIEGNLTLYNKSNEM